MFGVENPLFYERRASVRKIKKGIQPMFAAPIFPCCICNRKTKKAKLVFGLCLIFLLVLVVKGGYAMQPPPPPLDLPQLRMLISEADLLVVGKIDRVKETEGTNGGETKKTVEAVLSVEKILKGKVAGKTIIIKETYKTFDSQLPGLGSKGEGEPKKMIVSSRAGPSCYHGRYRQGMRIVVLLEKIEGTDEYRPLGSGTYDKHLCEFLIDDNGIKTFYFKFEDDVGKYAGCEERFIDLIRKLIKSGSKEENHG